ncbi:hypothetical protein CCUS01_00245 [Colletotrichum cuscutae]|uniref:Uncharacterized protein n=1 Tax=Colletotrichum cuscutae TaxID=1209917 RepID=A0AAI9YE09_9PEZI|nr:hypothetical protein CCUS01_00245 [Colletotrichum cuscutae]
MEARHTEHLGNLSSPKGPWGVPRLALADTVTVHWSRTHRDSSKSRRPAQPQDVLDAVFPANWVKFDYQATASNLDLSRAVEGVSEGEGEPEGASNIPPVADGRRYIHLLKFFPSNLSATTSLPPPWP